MTQRGVRGLFLGLDAVDMPGIDLPIQGALSAAALHSEFEDRLRDGKWELFVGDSTKVLTRANIAEAIREFCARADRTTGGAIIYLAGHGCSFGGRYIFCPADFNIKMPEVTGLPLSLLCSLISGSRDPEETIIVIFDTCRINLDGVAEGAEVELAGCAIVHTCRYGGHVVEVDGVSDFARIFIAELGRIAVSVSEGYERVKLYELLNDFQSRKVKAGSGFALDLDMVGAGGDNIVLDVAGASGTGIQKMVWCELWSRCRRGGTFARIQGEVLSRVGNFLGAPIDPNVVRVVRPKRKTNEERLVIALRTCRAVRTAKLIQYVLGQWPSMFFEARVSGAVSERGDVQKALRGRGFELWSDGDRWIGFRRFGAVSAKVDVEVGPQDRWTVIVSCLGEDEEWPLGRIEVIMFELVRDLIEEGT